MKNLTNFPKKFCESPLWSVNSKKYDFLTFERILNEIKGRTMLLWSDPEKWIWDTFLSKFTLEEKFTL